MVMGANIGTSVTNTIVSITHIGDRTEFERAFACAVIHDIFNWLAVIVLLIVEVTTGYLFHLTLAITDGISFQKGENPPDVLKGLTRPFTDIIIHIDKKILEGWSLNQTEYLNETSILKTCHVMKPQDLNGGQNVSFSDPEVMDKPCGYLMAYFGLPDVWLGAILLVFSLFLLSTCLVILVKILNSMMEDKMAAVIKRVLNAQIPYVPWLTDYFAMLIGAIITFLVQSSSVFTSTLTPLVGTGLFTLERAYPLTLGSNVGTTTTGLLAALAADGDHLQATIQIALCHLFFNISGILLFFPVPFMRWPIPLAKVMGQTVAKYRWFALFYLAFMFFLFPLYIFGLSLIGPFAIYIGFLPLLILSILIGLINVAQSKRPSILPDWFHNWDFLPEWMRSLEPVDRILNHINCCRKYQDRNEPLQDLPKSALDELGEVNDAFEMSNDKA
ncbi:sodium-dependent phosphate transport protein 2A-like isoform X2 [Tigriopus californicus]|nr:sodium-dependent phosphate transport protein 2A-like isoform X2 [Tigriopus californicus]